MQEELRFTAEGGEGSNRQRFSGRILEWWRKAQTSRDQSETASKAHLQKLASSGAMIAEKPRVSTSAVGGRATARRFLKCPRGTASFWTRFSVFFRVLP